MNIQETVSRFRSTHFARRIKKRKTAERHVGMISPESLEQRLLLSGTNASPEFAQDTFAFEIPLDSVASSVIGSVSASDTDGDALSFALGDVFSQSAISVGHDGSLTLVDPEILSVIGVSGRYDLEVSVSDGEATDTATIGITVGNSTAFADNSAPEFESSSLVFQVPLDAEPGAVGSIGAHDPDGDPLAFSGFDFQFGAFEVHEDGSLVVNADRLDGFAAGSSVELVAYAGDGLTQSSTLITVELIPSQGEIDNTAPIFSDSGFHFEVSTDAAQGEILGQVIGEDADTDSLNFFLADDAHQGIPNAFGITTAGMVYVASDAALAALNVGDTVNLGVGVTDGFAMAETTLQKTLTEGDNAESTLEIPQFRQSSYSFNTAADSPRGTVLGVIEALDESGSPIAYGGGSGAVSITEDGRVVVTNAVALRASEASSEAIRVTATSEVGVAAVDLLLTVTPADLAGLAREFGAASDSLTTRLDVDGFLEGSPLSERLAVFGDLLLDSVDTSDHQVAEAWAQAQEQGQEGVDEPLENPASSAPSVFQFLPESFVDDSPALSLGDLTPGVVGSDNFETTSTITISRGGNDSFVAAAFPGLTSTAEITAKHSQEFVSEDEFVSVRSIRTTATDRLTSSETSTDVSDQEDFSRTVTRDLVVTIVNGTQTTYQYTISNNILYSVGDLPGVTDQDQDGLGVPESLVTAIRDSATETDAAFDGDAADTGAAQTAFFDSMFPSDGGSTDGDSDGPVEESSQTFGAVLQSTSSITVTLVETKVTLPDGTLGTNYTVSLTPSFSKANQAAGSAESLSKDGNLEDVDSSGESTGGSTGDGGDSSEAGSSASGGTLGGSDGGEGADSSGEGGEQSEFPEFAGEGNGHDVRFSNQFATFGSSSSLVDIGASLTVADGESVAAFAPSVRLNVNADLNSGGLTSSGFGFNVQDSDDEGFRYLSLGGSTNNGGLASFDYSSHLGGDADSSLQPSGTERTDSVSLVIDDVGYGNESGTVKLVSNRDYTDAAGNHFIEKSFVSSGGTTSGLAEFGFEETALLDSKKQKEGGNNFSLTLTKFESGGPGTHRVDGKRQVSSTFDYDAAIDESGSITDVILGLTGANDSSGTEQIIIFVERNELTENLPHIPGYRLDSKQTTETTLDLDYETKEGEVTGTLTAVTTTKVDIDVEGIFFTGDNGEEGTPEPTHSTTTRSRTLDLSSEEARMLLGLPRPGGHILAEYRVRVEQALRTERLIEALSEPEHAELRGHLQGVLEALNAEVAQLLEEAAEAEVSADDLAAARQAAEAAVANLDTDAFIDRLDGDPEWIIDDVIVGGLTGVGHGGAFILNALTLHQIDSLDSYVDHLVETNGGAYGVANFSANVGVAAAVAAGGLYALAARGITQIGAVGLTQIPTTIAAESQAAMIAAATFIGGRPDLPHRVRTFTRRIQLSRFFATATNYRAVVQRSIFDPLFRRIPQNFFLRPEWHHWAIPNSVGRAGGGRLNQVVQAGWNLVPLPRFWNGFIGNGGFWFNRTREAIGTSIIWGPGSAYYLTDWFFWGDDGEDDGGEENGGENPNQ